MIRARLEELRRERIEVLAEARGRSLIYPTPYHRAASERPGMNADRISRPQWQDFPRSMDFPIPRPRRPEGFRVKN
jgi:hypothetical protein